MSRTLPPHPPSIHVPTEGIGSRAGYQTACIHRQYAAPGGAQAEYARITLAEGILVATPEVPSADLIPSFVAASDVLGTGWFGAVAAEVGPGKTVASSATVP